jgi:hypothetical protein
MLTYRYSAAVLLDELRRNDRGHCDGSATPLGDLFSVSRGLQLLDWMVRLALALLTLDPNCCLIPALHNRNYRLAPLNLPSKLLYLPGKLLEHSRVPARWWRIWNQLQKLFRYVDIESSDWCRALRLVKLIFTIRSALLVRRACELRS